MFVVMSLDNLPIGKQSRAHDPRVSPLFSTSVSVRTHVRADSNVKIGNRVVRNEVGPVVTGYAKVGKRGIKNL
jgi:hypothetical protein